MNLEKKTKHLHFSTQENSIGCLEWDQVDSSQNLLTLSFMKELSSALNEIKQKNLKALILTSKKRGSFCAGADIKEIQKIKTREEMKKILDQAHDLFDQFERLECVKIAAIQGSCLGGGLEWALCCDYRFVADDPSIQIGLPEIRLGLVPGFGGCLRLPRLIGLKKSLEMILTGKSLNPTQAFKIGLIDEIIPELILKNKTLEQAKNIVQGKSIFPTKNHYKDKKYFVFLLEKTTKRILCFLAKKQVLKKSKGFYPAPLRALKLIQNTYGSSVSKKSMEKEKEAFCDLFQSPEAKNLIRVWTLINKAKKIRIDTPDREKNINRIGVLGAGVMGRAIAWLFADRGFQVRLIDIKDQKLCESLNWTKNLWEKQKINPYLLKQKRNRLSFSSNLWGLSTMDLLIEALPEDKKLKKNLISEVSKKLKPSCLFASNSSSLQISELAKSASQPENFFGFHFFNPVEKSLLIELSLTEDQKENFLPSLHKLSKKIGKIPIIVKDSPGFIVNRLLTTCLTEAFFLYEDGQEIEKVDNCYRQFGFPLGPFQLMDQVGLDICTSVMFHLKEVHLIPELPEWAYNVHELLGLGKKEAKGFYIHNQKRISVNRQTCKIKRKQEKIFLTDEEILQRGLYKMINEGKKLVKDDLVSSEEDIDLALILGIGFPAFLGGPMKYAQNIGLLEIKKQLEKLEKQHGKRFQAYF